MSDDWRAVFGGAAALDVYEDVLVPRLFEPLAEQVLDLAGVQPGDRVLDVACGPGTVAVAAARRGAHVTGCDINPAMLERARATSAAIEWVETAAAPLAGIADESFDVVTCQQGLQFFPDRPAAVSEMHRALVPGGRVALAVWASIEASPPFAALRAAVASVLGADADECFRHGPWDMPEPAALHALLVDGCFAHVQVVQQEVRATIDSIGSLMGMLAMSPATAAQLAPLADNRLHGPLVANIGLGIRP